MPAPDVLAYLVLIEKKTIRARGILQDLSVEEFLASEDARDIAFSCNHDIGEAINQMSRHFPQHAIRLTNYRDIIGSRNVMSHQLFDRDFEQLWHNLEAGLPVLLDDVRRLITEIQSGRLAE